MVEKMSDKENKGKLGFAIPFILIAFFATFISVDMFFTYKAVTTHTGVVSKNAYKNGLNYNDTIKASNVQDQKNFNIDLRMDNNFVSTIIKDKDNNLVNDLDIKAYIIRPLQSKLDFMVELTEEEGVYNSEIDLPINGQWKVRVVAIDKNNKQIQKSRLFIIK